MACPMRIPPRCGTCAIWPGRPPPFGTGASPGREAIGHAPAWTPIRRHEADRLPPVWRTASGGRGAGQGAGRFHDQRADAVAEPVFLPFRQRGRHMNGRHRALLHVQHRCRQHDLPERRFLQRQRVALPPCLRDLGQDGGNAGDGARRQGRRSDRSGMPSASCSGRAASMARPPEEQKAGMRRPTSVAGKFSRLLCRRTT